MDTNGKCHHSQNHHGAHLSFNDLWQHPHTRWAPDPVLNGVITPYEWPYKWISGTKWRYITICPHWWGDWATIVADATCGWLDIGEKMALVGVYFMCIFFTRTLRSSPKWSPTMIPQNGVYLHFFWFKQSTAIHSEHEERFVSWGPQNNHTDQSPFKSGLVWLDVCWGKKMWFRRWLEFHTQNIGGNYPIWGAYDLIWVAKKIQPRTFCIDFWKSESCFLGLNSLDWQGCDNVIWPTQIIMWTIPVDQCRVNFHITLHCVAVLKLVRGFKHLYISCCPY